jgi:hypothetical protein
MNDIKDLTGGRLDAKAAHDAAERTRETYADKARETPPQARHDAAKPQDDEPRNEASPLDDATRRRAAYTRLADGLIALMDVRAMLVQGCEIDNGLEHQPRIEAALLEHMDALMTHADFFNPRTIAKFYVELRMHADELTPPHALPAST